MRQTVDALVEANPDLAWLLDMEERGDIDWRRVRAIHDSWAYEQSGLGAGAALAVAIVASVFVGPAAAGMLGATGAAVSAAASSLATTATVSAVNNRGDLGDVFDDTFSSDSLRSAAVAGASAGITQGVMGDTTNTAGLDFSNAGDVARFAGQRTAQTAINAGVSTAIEGGSLSDNLEAGLDDVLTEVVSAVLFDAIGDYAHEQNWAEGGLEKVALHALAGGAVAEATGGDFRTGALAAGANEALVDHLAELVDNDPQLLVAASQITGIVAAEMTNGDVNDGAFIAGQSTRYNYLTHQQVDAYAEEALGCEQRGDCDEVQERYRQLSLAQQDELIALCATDAEACVARYQSLVDDSMQFREALDSLGGREIPWRIGLDSGPLLGQYLEAESVVSQEGFAQFLQDRHGLDHEQASVLSAMAAGAVGGIAAARTKASGFYDSRAWRHNYENFYNGNVTSTTVPPYSSPNVRLAGQRHPETGIVYDQRGFPVFDSVTRYDTRFPGDQFRATDYQGQMRMATRDLRSQLDSNPQLRSQFTQDQLQSIQSGKASIPGFTWHHHQDAGRMQLVPRMIHRKTGHIGGESMSGGR